MYGYLYKTTNLITNKIYIGQKKSEIFLAQRYLGSGKYLKRAIVKYGKENFVTELLCWCESKNELDEKEIYYISEFNSTDSAIGYNIAKGGEGSNGGGFTGKHHTQETLQKLSSASTKYNWARGRKLAQEIPTYVNGMKDKPAKNKGHKRVWKDGHFKFVSIENLNSYLDNGWIKK